MVVVIQERKGEFIGLLAYVKVRNGSTSNIKRCTVDGKNYGLKSNDHHVIMRQFLPLVARKNAKQEFGSYLDCVEQLLQGTLF